MVQKAYKIQESPLKKMVRKETIFVNYLICKGEIRVYIPVAIFVKQYLNRIKD